MVGWDSGSEVRSEFGVAQLFLSSLAIGDDFAAADVRTPGNDQGDQVSCRVPSSNLPLENLDRRATSRKSLRAQGLDDVYAGGASCGQDRGYHRGREQHERRDDDGQG